MNLLLKSLAYLAAQLVPSVVREWARARAARAAAAKRTADQAKIDAFVKTSGEDPQP